MYRSSSQLRRDALRIWAAGLAAVHSPRLIFDAVEFDGAYLRIGDEAFRLSEIRRIAVVGAGKAVAGMAQALEQAIGPQIIREKQLAGLVSIPADCRLPTDVIRLHVGRPAGVNEPTAEGVAGARSMLELVAELGPDDLCLCLLTGGGSALLPAPVEGFTLADKAALTSSIAAAGGSIEQLNAVRRELSVIKGGGLARACRAGRLVTLVVSDVLGDDLSLVASGPTVLRRPTPAAAAAILRSLNLDDCAAARRALALLDEYAAAGVPWEETEGGDAGSSSTNQFGCRLSICLLGNNATAVDAAGIEAERLGYSHAMICANGSEGTAEEVAARLATMARQMRTAAGPDCLIWGGEPTVRLAPPDVRGRGGRNQQLCLAALAALDNWRGIALVSGGTDGEDGPTDAAGSFVDEHVAATAERLGVAPQPYLARNDAYSFFEQVGGLLKTGPTHTNVCDVRVVTVSRE